MDRNGFGKSRAEVGCGINVLTRPAALSDKWRRDEEYRAKSRLRWCLRESVDQYRATDRMTDDDRAIVELRKLLLERRLPYGERGLIFVWHPRVANLEVG